MPARGDQEKQEFPFIDKNYTIVTTSSLKCFISCSKKLLSLGLKPKEWEVCKKMNVSVIGLKIKLHKAFSMQMWIYIWKRLKMLCKSNKKVLTGVPTRRHPPPRCLETKDSLRYLERSLILCQRSSWINTSYYIAFVLRKLKSTDKINQMRFQLQFPGINW